MSAEKGQLAGDPARELAALVRIREGGWFQISLQILVANPLQVKFSAQNDLEQAAVFRADRTQSPKTPRGFDRSTDWVQDAVRSFWFSHYRERLQIALIRRATQLDAPTGIGNAFAQGQPPQHDFALTGRSTADAKPPRIIDRGLDPQHASLLIVHFDRVLFDPVFHARPLHAPFQMTGGFPGKTTIRASPQKPHHLRRTELLDGLTDQGRINGGQLLRRLKQDIGRVLGLPKAPVVAPQMQTRPRSHPRVHPPRPGRQQFFPAPLPQLVQQRLGPRQIRNPGEAVVLLLVGDSLPIHRSCQPLPPVHADLNTHRQPALQTDVHQPKFPVEVIKVEMQTLALLRYQRQFLLLPVPANPECLAGLDAGQHANQPFWNSVSSLNPASDLLFGLLRRTQIHKGSSSLLRQLFGPRLDACRQLLHERPEVLVQHPLARQKDIHPLPVTNRPQAPTKQDAIKTCYAPPDAVSVPCQKTLHDCPPYEVRQKHHAGNGHGASLYFGCGQRPRCALSVLCVCLGSKAACLPAPRDGGDDASQRIEVARINDFAWRMRITQRPGDGHVDGSVAEKRGAVVAASGDAILRRDVI